MSSPLSASDGCKGRVVLFASCLLIFGLPFAWEIPGLTLSLSSLCLLLAFPFLAWSIGRTSRNSFLLWAIWGVCGVIILRSGFSNARSFLLFAGWTQCFAWIVAHLGFRTVRRLWCLSSALVVAFAGSGFLLSLFGITQVLAPHHPGFPYVGAWPRPIGPFSNPTALVAFLSVGILLAALEVEESQHRLSKLSQWLSGWGAILVGILSLSKNVLFPFAEFLVLRAKKDLKFLRAVSIFLLLLGLLAPFVVVQSTSSQEGPDFPGLVKERVLEGFGFRIVPTNYFETKRAALLLFLEHPTFGIGLGVFPRATEELIERNEISPAIRGFQPHSTYLGILAECGLFGITVAILLIGGLVRYVGLYGNGDPMHGKAASAVLLCFALMAIHSDLVRYPVLWAAFGMVPGLVSGIRLAKRLGRDA